MKEMTLAEAFMERNDIKKEIETLKELSQRNVYFEKGMVSNPKNKEYILALTNNMDKLCSLNIAIGEANLANNSFIKKVETVNSKIAYFNELKSLVSSFKEKQRASPYAPEGSNEFIEFETTITYEEVIEIIRNLEREKRALEKELARNNSVITIKVN